MGQKTHPYGFRIGIIKPWKSKWFQDRNYAAWLHEDLAIKAAINKKYANAGIADIEIERFADNVKCIIHTSRPGTIIGKGGRGVEDLRKDLQKLTKSTLMAPDVQDVRKADTNATLVAQTVATHLERRVAFRRAMKKAVSTAMKLGVKGIRIEASGRLGGSEIARTEWYREGRVPLHTLRADIDYGTATAHTTAGTVGIKVWIFKGEINHHAPRHVGAQRR